MVAELIPVLLVFGSIVIFKINMTSGPMQSLIFFAQMSTLIVTLSQTYAHHMVARTHSIILGTLTLDFFIINELSFYLWEGATVLSNTLFRYITTMFALLLILTYIMIIRNNNSIIIRCNPVRKMAAKLKLFNNAIVHCISTFLILTYAQYTFISFQLLSQVKLYGESGVTALSAVRLQGSVDYFGIDHVPYAIPALLVLVFLSLPPPLLLISYPLLWKIKAKVKVIATTDDESTTWLIRKLLPLIDSFQGVFKDNRRMFAGLLFMWRVILVGIAALSTNLLEFYILMEIALVILLVIHAVARPYRRQLYNIIDFVLFADMAVVNAISWYVLFHSVEASKVAISFQLVLMYLPLVCLAGIGVFLLLQKCGLVSETNIVLCLLSNKEDEPSGVIGTREIARKQENKLNDDDLFLRGEEANHPGFELQTQETTLTTGGTK